MHVHVMPAVGMEPVPAKCPFEGEAGAVRHPARRGVVDRVRQSDPFDPHRLQRPVGDRCCRPGRGATAPRSRRDPVGDVRASFAESDVAEPDLPDRFTAAGPRDRPRSGGLLVPSVPPEGEPPRRFVVCVEPAGVPLLDLLVLESRLDEGTVGLLPRPDREARAEVEPWLRAGTQSPGRQRRSDEFGHVPTVTARSHHGDGPVSAAADSVSAMSIVDQLIANAGTYLGIGVGPADEPDEPRRQAARIIVTPLPQGAGVAIDYETFNPESADRIQPHIEHAVIGRLHGGGAILVSAHAHADSVAVLHETAPGEFTMSDDSAPFPTAITISVPEPGRLVYVWSYAEPGGTAVPRDRAELTLRS